MSIFNISILIQFLVNKTYKLRRNSEIGELMIQKNGVFRSEEKIPLYRKKIV